RGRPWISIWRKIWPGRRKVRRPENRSRSRALERGEAPAEPVDSPSGTARASTARRRRRRTAHRRGGRCSSSRVIERSAGSGYSSLDPRLTQEPLNPLPKYSKAMGGVAAWVHVRRDGFGGRDFP